MSAVAVPGQHVTSSTVRGAPLVALLAAFTTTGCIESCSKRPHLSLARDAGPAVVVVEQQGAMADGDRLPEMEEVEPNDTPPQATTVSAPALVRGRIEGIAPPSDAPPSGPPGEHTTADLYRVRIPGEGLRTLRVELSAIGGLRMRLSLPGRRAEAVAAGPTGDPPFAPPRRDLEGPRGDALVVGNIAVVGGTTVDLVVSAARRPNDPVAPPWPQPYRLALRVGARVPGEEQEPNDAPALAEALAPGQDRTGSFDRDGDEDWLRLSPDGGVPDGGTARIELSPVENVAARLRVHAGSEPVDKSFLVEAKGLKGRELRLRNAPLVEGAFISLRSEGSDPDARWGLRLVVEPPRTGEESEPNQSPAQATSLGPVADLPSSGSLSGYLWPGDVDVLRLAAPTDRAALARLELAPPEGVDARLEVITAPDAKGRGGAKVLAKFDDAAPGQPEIAPALAIPAGGALLVRIAARAKDECFDAPWMLTWTASPDDPDAEHEPDDASAAARPLDEGKPLVGHLAPRGDVDHVTLTPPDGAATAELAIEGAGDLAVAFSVADGKKRVTLKANEGGRSASLPVTPGRPVTVSLRETSGKRAAPADPYTLTVRYR